MANAILKIESPFITERNYAKALWTGLNIHLCKMPFTPSEVVWRGDPCVQPGDVLGVPAADGTIYTHIVTSQTLRFGGGFCIESTCCGEENA